MRAAASTRLGEFGRWWLNEFLALFPASVGKWLTGGGRLSLVLVPERDAVALELIDEGRHPIASTRIPRTEDVPAAIADFLTTHGVANKDVAIGIRLPTEKMFGRKLVLPVEAARALDQVLVQDLIAKTPFRPAAIYHDYRTARTAEAGKIVVWQWLARREFVAEALAHVGLGFDRVTFVESAAGGSTDEPASRIMLGRSDRAGRPRARTAALALAASALVLSVLAAGLEFRRQEAVRNDLEQKLTAARARAGQVQDAIQKLEHKQALLLRLRAQKTERPGLLDAWEEATRLLPVHSWLSELRLAEIANTRDQQVTMTGFSAAASSLVGLIDQSPLFSDASLTAPIALDPVEQRERFALQAKLRTQQQIKRAAR